MLFNSIEFLFVFLPLVLILYYAAPKRYGRTAPLVILAAASLGFYAYWSLWAVPILLGSITVNYLLGRWLARSHRGAVLALGIVLNLAVLGYFKYANFFVDNAGALAGAHFAPLHVILPLGISFYTFEQITFLCDVKRGRTEPGSALSYGLFVGFFPHLIAGPIVQHRDLGAQFQGEDKRAEVWTNLSIGFALFAIGLVKKVLLAETMEPFASGLFEAADRGQPIPMGGAWFAALAYTFQIFFDFSGYSDMACGLARMFGFKLPVNFFAPYRARSIIEFWRRWHITLSTFLRDYVYIPLGGNRLGEARRYINLALTMLIGGLWHGASWTFVAWGGLHGAYLIVAHLWEAKVKANPGFWRRLLFHALTLLAVVLAWVTFRAETFAGAAHMYGAMFGAYGFSWGVEDNAVVAVLIGFIVIALLPDTAEFFEGRDAYSQMSPPPRAAALKWLRWKPSLGWALGGALMLFWCVIFLSKVSEFIYYQF